MKRRIVILVFGAAMSAAFVSPIHGQGFLFFENMGGGGSAQAPVYGPEAGNPLIQKWGNSEEAIPPGGQTYTGIELAGTGYRVQAWYSMTPPEDVYALNLTGFEAPNSLTTFLNGGFFSRGDSYIPGITSSDELGVYLQARAWDNTTGEYASWEAAWSAALVGSGKAVGWSKVFWQPVAYGSAPPPGLVNFESFNIFIVPEPSTLSLLGLSGLMWLLIRRRR